MAKIKRNDAVRAPAQPQPPASQPRPRDSAPTRPQPRPAARRRTSPLYILALAFFLLVFLVSGGLLVHRLWQDREVQADFTALEQQILPPVSAEGDQPVDNATRFASVKAQNPDFIGWISIDGTNLSFPVMYTPDNPDFYLRHNFSGEYSNSGTPYLDANCTLTQDACSNNLIIYGHNMKTGTIFGVLTDYKKAETYREHPVIRLDTMYSSGEYEVFAAFAIDVVADTSFAYNTYIDMDKAAFDEFVREAKQRSDVDSGITPVYGDELLTLSTCEYSSANGRYVVCARRVTG